MKATKRSLIVSIAILCVCALSLTSASFAWFSASQTATVSKITLNVAASSDLKISTDDIATTTYENMQWSTNIELNETLNLSDASTNDAVNFYVPAVRENVDADNGSYTGAYEKLDDNSSIASFTVHFRSTTLVGVNANTQAAFDVEGTLKDGLNDALRMAIGTKIFANSDEATFEDQVVTDTNVDTTAVTVYKNTTASVVIEALTLDDASGYYYGTATVKFWVEGTDDGATSGNTGVKCPDVAIIFTAAA